MRSPIAFRDIVAPVVGGGTSTPLKFSPYRIIW
jgi:hypothetical protein